MLFEAGNVQSLEDAILNVVDSYSSYVKKAQTARKRIRREYSFNHVTDQIEKLYYQMSGKVD
jgi:glycosyltransferase involved in cell wall biosynthesis